MRKCFLEVENYNFYKNYIDIHKSCLSNVYTNPRQNFYSESENKKIIILADDNQVINICNKKIISDIIQEAGITDVDIVCLNDGIDILKHYLNNEEKIKVIITDENMDYLNGSEAIKIIRNIEKLRNKKRIRIISLTCNEDNNIGNLIIRAGADFILSKPLSKQSIKGLLEKNNLFK